MMKATDMRKTLSKSDTPRTEVARAGARRRSGAFRADRSVRASDRQHASTRESTYAKKSLGQNFLKHAQTAERIAAAAPLTNESVVLEVGPGTGKLTRALLARAKKVVAVEADERMLAVLQEAFAPELDSGKLELFYADIRTFDVEGLPKGYQVVANIPYYLTGELIRRLLTARNQPSALTLLVQKEVAERIARSAKESLLSLSVKAYGEPRYRFTVPRGAFSPAPKVDSGVIVVNKISHGRFKNGEEEARFFSLIHAGFAHKRKQLAKNFQEAGLTVSGFPERIRAEDVSLEKWLELARQ